MKKNLDHLFQENFKEFHELPSDRVWKSIEASLDGSRKKRRAIPIWWTMGGVAALIAILLLITDPFEKASIPETNVTDQERLETKGNEKDKTPIDTNDNPYATTSREELPENQQGDTNEQDRDGQRPGLKENPSKTPSSGNGKKAVDNRTKREALASADKSPAKGKNELSGEILDQGHKDALAMEQPHGQKENENPLTENSALDPDHPLSKNPSLEKGTTGIENTTEEPTPKKKSIYDEIMAQTEEAEKIAEGKEQKWSVEPNIAPVYFNGFGEGSPVASSFSSNSKTGNVNLSYGVLVAYEISKKVRIRSGIHKVDYGYDTNDVNITSSFFTEPGISALKNVDYARKSENLVLTSNSPTINPSVKPPSNALDAAVESPSKNGSMVQQFGYLEIPLEINYTLVDRKFGVHLVGGLSSLFLTNNDILLESDGLSTTIGEANNLNSVNFSTNVGFGLNYKFTPKVRLNVEPVFKYQLNTFSNTAGSFQPFSIGIYSGFSLKF
jgi:hypothetical protein